MSSPPALDFPSSDVEMDDGTLDEPGLNAPPAQQPLFLAGTPSVSGTPARRWGSNAPDSTPLQGATARRAVGMSTPQRTPLFAGEHCSVTG